MIMIEHQRAEYQAKERTQNLTTHTILGATFNMSNVYSIYASSLEERSKVERFFTRSV